MSDRLAWHRGTGVTHVCPADERSSCGNVQPDRPNVSSYLFFTGDIRQARRPCAVCLRLRELAS